MGRLVPPKDGARVIDLLCGDVLTVLPTLPAESVQCVVTSPPYYGLRDYGVDGQIGLEETPEAYVTKLIAVFREVRRVLRDDGVLWLNLGDSYWGGKGQNGTSKALGNAEERGYTQPRGTLVTAIRPTDRRHDTIKPKDLIGIPWRVAFALQADGWWLRSDCIWAKPNPMPESVKDRPTKAHEYVFLLTKAARYYYDAEAIRQPLAEASIPRATRGVSDNGRWANGGAPGSTARTMSRPRPNMKEWSDDMAGGGSTYKNGHSGVFAADGRCIVNLAGANCKTVWTIATQGYAGAHFATLPEKLALRCILAGSKAGDTVLDPFCGSGTVMKVAAGLGRASIGIDLNPAYIELARQRVGALLC